MMSRTGTWGAKEVKAIEAIPFVDNADPKKINKRIIENPEQFLKETLSNRFTFGAVEIMDSGVYRLLGFRYDLRPWLKRFVYKQYGRWQDIYAIDRTNLRKLVSGKIDKILDYEQE